MCRFQLWGSYAGKTSEVKMSHELSSQVHAERLKVWHCSFLAELRLQPLRSDQRPWNLALWKWHRRHQSDLNAHFRNMHGHGLDGSIERSGTKQCCGTILKLTVDRVSLHARKLYFLVDKRRPIWCHNVLRIPLEACFLTMWGWKPSLESQCFAKARRRSALNHFEGKSAMKIDKQIQRLKWLKISCRRHSHLGLYHSVQCRRDTVSVMSCFPKSQAIRDVNGRRVWVDEYLSCLRLLDHQEAESQQASRGAKQCRWLRQTCADGSKMHTKRIATQMNSPQENPSKIQLMKWKLHIW